MINNVQLIHEFTAMLAQFYRFLELMNRQNMLDTAVASEKWVAQICGVIWKDDFKRSQNFKANADSYDLESVGGGTSLKSKIAIQVTSNRRVEKIVDTLLTFQKNKHYVSCPDLYVFLLGDRPDYGGKKLTAALQKIDFSFDMNKNIIGAKELLTYASNLDIDQLKTLVGISRDYFSQDAEENDRKRKNLEEKIFEYKKAIPKLQKKLVDVEFQVNRRTAGVYTGTSAEAFKNVLSSIKSIYERTNQLFMNIANTIPLAEPWMLKIMDSLALATYSNLVDTDDGLEVILHDLNKAWDLGVRMEDIEKSKKALADLYQEKEKLEQEQKEVQSEMESLEFMIKWYQPEIKKL